MAAKKKIGVRAEKNIIDMIGNGHTMSYTCELLGFSRTTEWKYRKAHPEYEAKLAEALERRVEIVEDALYSNALSGDTNAQKFFLTNRSQSWQVENVHRHTGAKDSDPLGFIVKEVVVEIPSTAVTDRSRAILEKKDKEDQSDEK